MSKTPIKKQEDQEQLKQHKPILVFYISITGIRSEDIESFMGRVSKKIVPNIDAEAIIIPVEGQTRVECINPVYIRDTELIKKHERLMAELHEHITYNIELTKKENE